MLTINWDAIGATATVIGIPLAVLGIYVSIRTNRKQLTDINRRVTTPDTVTGTIGEEVANIANRSAEHEAIDDARFKEVHEAIGQLETHKPKKKASMKKSKA